MGRKKFVYDYPRPAVAVDLVIVTREKEPLVLLVQRKHEPFAGKWALPGGFVNMDETLEQAARRELLEETGVLVAKLQQLGTFGDPGRDPRGRVISVVYLAEIKPGSVRPQAADDAAAVGWFTLHRPPPLAFDHAAILALARRSATRRSPDRKSSTGKKSRSAALGPRTSPKQRRR
jgi:8-oxo-dGTP diphosphatase